jgi:alpha-L-fucosidase
MLGIGPDGTGKFDPMVVKAIKEAGSWLKINGEAIYSTRPREGDLWKEGDAIRFTRTKDNKIIYAICREWPGRQIKLRTVKPGKDSEIYMLGYDKPLKWNYDETNGLIIEIPDLFQVESERPSKLAWCFKIKV